MPDAISTEPLLVQMVKSITRQKRTGLLKVESLGEKHMERGEIYFEGGQPLRVRTDQETGKEAFKLISSWKHITCSFHGMSRAYPGNHPMPITAPEHEIKEGLLVRLLPSGVSKHQTDNLMRTAQTSSKSQTGDISQPPLSEARGQNTSETQSDALMAARTPMPSAQSVQSSASANPRALMLSTQPVQSSTAANPRALMSSAQPIQSPAMRGIAPTPHPPVQRIPRWTTPLTPEGAHQAMLRKPPVTPRLGLASTAGEDFLPGRQGVFKARSMTTTMQCIQQMERRERIIYVLLDGYRTIQDIARLTHRSESEIEQTLLQLTHRGYTEYIGQQQVAPTPHEKMANLFRKE